jgi:hypothetical protein
VRREATNRVTINWWYQRQCGAFGVHHGSAVRRWGYSPDHHERQQHDGECDDVVRVGAAPHLRVHRIHTDENEHVEFAEVGHHERELATDDLGEVVQIVPEAQWGSHELVQNSLQGLGSTLIKTVN